MDVDGQTSKVRCRHFSPTLRTMYCEVISHMDDFLVPEEWLHGPPPKKSYILHIDRFDMCLMFFRGVQLVHLFLVLCHCFVLFLFVAPEGATALLGKVVSCVG